VARSLPYERHHETLLPLRTFLARMAGHATVALVILALSLGLGVLGYHGIAGLRWIDALENAAMILTGMGPVAKLHSDGAKLFASAYALFSGVVFITSMGIVITPALHRLLHHFHIEAEREQR